eukprot:9475921-Pyramimonas_sp.AAC.2
MPSEIIKGLGKVPASKCRVSCGQCVERTGRDERQRLGLPFVRSSGCKFSVGVAAMYHFCVFV